MALFVWPGDEARARGVPGGRQGLRRPPGLLQGLPEPQAGPVHPAPQEPLAEPRAAPWLRRWGEGGARREAGGAVPPEAQGRPSHHGGGPAAAGGAQEEVRGCLCVQKITGWLFFERRRGGWRSSSSGSNSTNRGKRATDVEMLLRPRNGRNACLEELLRKEVQGGSASQEIRCRRALLNFNRLEKASCVAKERRFAGKLLDLERSQHAPSECRDSGVEVVRLIAAVGL